MVIKNSMSDFIEIEQQKTVVYQLLCDIFETFKITDTATIKEYTEIILENLDSLVKFKNYLYNEKSFLFNDISQSFKWENEHVANLYLFCILLYKNLLLQNEIVELKKIN